MVSTKMSEESLQPGVVIEDTYRIVRRIGEGGMGEVYEATHARLAGRYAIKLLLREIASDPVLMARFQREAQITSSLRHPNIVQVLDFRQLPGGTPYIVMEFLEGVDLATEIQRVGPMPLVRVQALIDQIASGLAAAHEQGIVHRDLKPANLILVVLSGSHNELVKIVDFGISKTQAARTQLTSTAMVMGTPQYMAPEQALGQGDRIDARTDQFALASIAYEMLAGRCAFAGDTIPTVLYQLVHVEPPPLLVNGQPVSPVLDAVIRRGLAKQPEGRYPSVIDFARAFGAAASGVAARTDASAAFANDRTVLPAAIPPAIAPSSLDAAGSPQPAQTPFGVSALATRASQEGPNKPRRYRLALAVGGITVALGAAALVLSLKACTPSSAPPASAAPPSAVAPPASPAAPAPAAQQISVEVQDAPANLKVSIDGGELQPLPIHLVKGSGAHQLVFQAPGYRAKTMQLDASKDIAMILSMKRLARAQAATERSEAARSQPVAVPESPVEDPAKSKPGRFKRSFNAVKHVWLGD
jgi:serine/threonine-protein kinase